MFAPTRQETDRGKLGTTRRASTQARGHGYEYVLDGFSGTCTSKCLHALRTRRRSRVVCIDRDHTLESVRKNIPKKYWDRVLYIQDDIRALDEHTLLSRIKAAWPDAEWSKFTHLHLSPSAAARTAELTEASRGIGTSSAVRSQGRQHRMTVHLHMQ